MATIRRTFTNEFKEDAIELFLSSERQRLNSSENIGRINSNLNNFRFG